MVVPVKGGPWAKSRLGGAPAPRGRLALAMALDCLEAVLATPSVAGALVVTDDDAAAAAATAAGAHVVTPSPVTSGSPLDAAVRDGARAATAPQQRSRPGGPAPGSSPHQDEESAGVAVLLADVPALRPQELEAALAAAADQLAAGAGAVVVPDAAGRGTALLAAARAQDLPVAYGEGSAERHAAAGAVRLELDLPGLRRDVDTPADLRAVLALGVGPRTRAVLELADPARAVAG